MYKIYADDNLIYDSTLEDYKITKGQVSHEVNKSGSFTFTIYKDHPFFDRIIKLKTKITVYKNSDIVFQGRVLNDVNGFYNDKTFTCEGELSYFLDSIQRPWTFTGTPKDLVIQFINIHNEQVEESKRFLIGDITIFDNNDYINRENSEYEDTLTNINTRLLDTLGGYIYISHTAEGKPIFNYYNDFPFSSEQTIEFGENLLDFTKTNNCQEVATAIIGLGAVIETEKQTDEEKPKERVTFKDINGGLDYVMDAEAVEKYGKIFKVVVWDDVTEPENLLRKTREYLAESIKQNITIELSAIDLSLLDRQIDTFSLGDYITIISRPHGVNERLLLSKQTLDLLKPSNDKITLGYTYASFTDKTANVNNVVVQKVTTIEANYLQKATLSQVENGLQRQISKQGQTLGNVQTSVTTHEQSLEMLESTVATMKTKMDQLPYTVFQSIVVNPSGVDRATVTLSKTPINSGIVVTNGDINAWTGYVKGVSVSGNVATVLLSETRSGNIRLNFLYQTS